jgi:hypothetical protein
MSTKAVIASFLIAASVVLTGCAGTFSLPGPRAAHVEPKTAPAVSSSTNGLTLTPDQCFALQQKIGTEQGIQVGLTFLAGAGGLGALGSLPVSNTGIKDGLVIGGGIGAVLASAAAATVLYISGQAQQEWAAGGCSPQ